MNIIKKKILILGSNGFFGKNLKKLLKCSDMELFFFEKKDVDVLDKEKLDTIFIALQPNIVINCCGLIGSSESNKLLDQFYILNTNITININILECCDKYNVEKIILFSTYRLFANNIKENYTEDNMSEYLHGESNVNNIGYLLSKSIMDTQIKLLKQKSNINITCFILPNIFGLFDKFCINGRIVPSLMYRMYMCHKTNNDLFINSNRNTLLNIIFIDDIVELLHKCIYENINSNVLVFNEKSTLTLYELSEKIAKIINFKNQIYFNDNDTQSINENLMKPKLLNFKKYFNDFEFTKLSFSLRKTFNHFQSTIEAEAEENNINSEFL